VRTAIGGIIGPDQSTRTEAILRAARAMLDDERQQAAVLQAELGRMLSTLTEARSDAERSSDIAGALQLIDASVLPQSGVPRAEAVRIEIAERRRRLANAESALKEAAASADELAVVEGPEFKARVETAERTLVSVEAVALLRDRADSAEKLAEEARRTDAEMAHLAALIAHGEAIGLREDHCPLCAAARTEQEFRSAIAAARDRLTASGRRIAAALDAAERIRAELAAALEQERQTRSVLAELRGRIAAANQRRAALRSMFEVDGLGGVDMQDLEAGRRAVREARQRLVELERAQRVLDASGAADRIAGLENRVTELRAQSEAAAGRVAEAERIVETARQIDTAARTIANEILVEQFETVMPLLKELYRRLRPHADWIEIESDFGGRVRGSLNFTVGEGRNPQFLFSSGQRRAAGLAFLLAVHLSRPWCLWRSVLLDDPVQHIDDYRALNLVEVLSAIRRDGRQVVVAVKDPAPADLLCRRLRSTVNEPGCRYELGAGELGGVAIQFALDIAPMPRQVLSLAAS
jgi:chromosome segregation protein